MRAEIVTIGDELCRGETVDTNATWLAAELWQREIETGWIVSCRDRVVDIRRAVEQAAARADLVVCSGGLGPTEDDLTLDTLAALVGQPPVVHEPSRERWRARFAPGPGLPTGAAPGLVSSPLGERQLRVPSGARAFDNPAGAAPGFEIAVGGVPVVALPGVPSEMKAIFAAHVAGRVEALLAARGPRPRIGRRVWRCFGKGESALASALDGLLAPDDPGASLHYNVSFPETLVKLVVRAADTAAVEARLATLGAELVGRLGDAIYAEGDDSLAAVLGRVLVARDQTCATAESCTGGLLGALLTEPPGASRFYLGGVVAYANHEKVRALGVSPATLERDGAVSEACVREMAVGVRRATGADLGLAVSGVAGPDGGTVDKPVGLVWIAAAGAGERVVTKRMMWPGSRAQIRQLAAAWAMTLGRQLVERA
jgi:nicotinamide-nucleotide amidase